MKPEFKYTEYSISSAIDELRHDIERQFFLGSPFAMGRVTGAKDLGEKII